MVTVTHLSGSSLDAKGGADDTATSIPGSYGWSNPILFEVSITHRCILCDLTEKYPDSEGITSMSSVDGNRMTGIVQITSPSVKRDIEFIRKYDLTKKADLVSQQPNQALMRVTYDYGFTTYSLLNQAEILLLESPVTRNGIDSEILLAKSHKAMDRFLSVLKEKNTYYDVKLRSKRYLAADDSRLQGLGVLGKNDGFFDLKAAKGLLSARQLDVFKLACNYGYYETPKKITVGELAERTGISESTLAEHLRKAEMKLLPVLGQILTRL